MKPYKRVGKFDTEFDGLPEMGESRDTFVREGCGVVTPTRSLCGVVVRNLWISETGREYTKSQSNVKNKIVIIKIMK